MLVLNVKHRLHYSLSDSRCSSFETVPVRVGSVTERSQATTRLFMAFATANRPPTKSRANRKRCICRVNWARTWMHQRSSIPNANDNALSTLHTDVDHIQRNLPSHAYNSEDFIRTSAFIAQLWTYWYIAVLSVRPFFRSSHTCVAARGESAHDADGRPDCIS